MLDSFGSARVSEIGPFSRQTSTPDTTATDTYADTDGVGDAALPQANYPDSLEDVYGSDSQYYDLPWLSFRNARWRLAELHR